jgi:hypothetical protein
LNTGPDSGAGFLTLLEGYIYFYADTNILQTLTARRCSYFL